MSNSANLAGLYSDVIDFLAQPAAYSHKPDRVQHLQTHISHVFIADPYVFKVKKPVDFGFLDYSTPQKRKHFCEREVELNRRLCDDTYLGVIAVIREGDRFSIGDPEHASAVEYAVKMRKLPEQYFLHTIIEEGSLSRTHLDRVAGKLAGFYSGQHPDSAILEYGTIEKIKYNTDENFRQTTSFVGQTIDRHAYRAIQAYTDRYFEENRPLFESRMAKQRIVDGHGDLHLDHIHITPEKVRIYDCIEFNERFRYGDLAADLAFLAMDLDFNGCWREERYFVDTMAKKLDDPDLYQLIDFYKCYRAYVKGKVKSLQSTEEEVDPDERAKAAEKAAEYFDLSLRYALLGSRPKALIFMGRIGSGKSTLAGNLADKLGMDIYSSDHIRKRLAGLPLHERTPEKQRPKLYAREMSAKTYRVLRERALEKLQEGESVVLDATFSNRRARREIIDALDVNDLDYLFVETQASDETIRNRLNRREQQDDVVSDARLEDFEQLDENYQSPDELQPGGLVRVSTEHAIEDTMGMLYMELIDRNLEKG
ncbi:MAG: AAA family ATPase [Balneolaceae bacterium]|nr:AAA family ATPase [Balneolaceae bacterium]